jgi:hypothetical protein
MIYETSLVSTHQGMCLAGAACHVLCWKGPNRDFLAGSSLASLHGPGNYIVVYKKIKQVSCVMFSLIQLKKIKKDWRQKTITRPSLKNLPPYISGLLVKGSN